jgi:hypothetical protein
MANKPGSLLMVAEKAVVSNTYLIRQRPFDFFASAVSPFPFPTQFPSINAGLLH